METSAWTEITDEATLTGLVGEPSAQVRDKVRSALTSRDVEWLQAAPFCVLATSDDQGNCDASPKGDPPGSLVEVLDERTIVVAERPGNRRVDGYRNVLRNPHVGMIFLIPGRGDTLRINGRGRLVSDAEFFADLAVQGKRPVLALVVEIDEIFHHCAKAFLRAKLWDPSSWDPEQLPERARLAKELDRPGDDLEQLRRYYGASYAKNLY